MLSNPSLAQAIALHKNGDGSAAEPLYRSVLATEPGNGEANHNLGVILFQRGALEESLSFLKAALYAKPDLGQYWLSYAGALLAAGKAGDAQALLAKGQAGGLRGAAFDALMQKAAALAAGTQGLLERAAALAAESRLSDAIVACREAVKREPDSAEAHFRLASLLSETGQIAEGFSHYMRRAVLAGAARKAQPNEKPHKTKHDREQAAFLGQNADTPDFHLEDGARLSGPAVNPVNATAALTQAWQQTDPQLVVIDDFLTVPALGKLRRYCAGATIWHRVYDAGYIGATPEDGLACPLMAQITQEIREVYPELIGDHAFRYLGAFKYDSTLSTGTNIHADNAVVNVNLYIAPDAANLDPESGGMDVWNVTAPPGEEMRRINGDERLARDYLERTDAVMTRIPHRANRAVIFKSDLIHKTSDCDFREGYLNKRINVSLLFGHRA